MASPITIGGVQVLAADQGDTFAWGAAIKAALAQVAASCLQTTGGSFPLTAELNLGSQFGLVAPYFKSSSALTALTGQVRLARGDGVNWRNVGNAKDMFLTLGDGSSAAADTLQFVDGQTFAQTQLTGQPLLNAHITGSQSGITTGSTVLFQSKDVDTDNAFNAATGVFTVPAGKGGAYLIACSVATSQATSAGLQVLSLVANGFTVAFGGYNAPVTAGSIAVTATAIVQIAAGATILASLSTTAGSCGALAGTGSALYIKRLV